MASKRKVIIYLIIIVTFIINFISINFLPDIVPIHFSGGEPDNFASKYVFAIIFPAVMVLYLVYSKFLKDRSIESCVFGEVLMFILNLGVVIFTLKIT